MNAKAMNAADFPLREVTTANEMRAVEALQKEVWGVPDLDVVPVSQLIAATAAGGVLIGAFDGSILIGFAYGFPGFEHGRPTHHSHMLAVKPEYRNANIGYRLKLAQRDFVLQQGIGQMTWTFDPLQTMNAHFNFSRLGVICDRYLADFYGSDAASFLHRNGTDRLWVTWQLASERVGSRIKKRAEVDLDDAKTLVESGEDKSPNYLGPISESFSGKILIEIPANVTVLEMESPELAAEWRIVTRRAFIEAFAAGFVVDNFIRIVETGKYVLAKPEV